VRAMELPMKTLRAVKATANVAVASGRWAWNAVPRRVRRGVFWSAGAVAALVLGVNLWVVGSTAGHRYEAVSEVPARQVAIVPGAYVYRSGRPSDVLADRLVTALELYRAAAVAKILVSGDHGRTEYDEVNAMRRWLEERGVPAEDIFMDHAGFDTCDTMQRASRVFGVRSAVVVTQAFHLPRAVYLARQVGIDAVGVEADRHVYRKAALNAIRESIARVKSFGEVHLGLAPHHLGPAIPIAGDGRATWDAVAWRSAR
jgi:SanA protein